MRGDVMTGVPHSSVGVNERPPSSGRIQTALRDRELESFGTQIQEYLFVDVEVLEIIQ